MFFKFSSLYYFQQLRSYIMKTPIDSNPMHIVYQSSLKPGVLITNKSQTQACNFLLIGDLS